MLITRRTSGRSLGTMKSVFPWMWGSTGQQNTFLRCIVVGVRTVGEVSCTRGAQIQLVKLAWRWNFIWWLLVSVDPHCGTCIKSLRILRWLLECWKTSASLSYTKFHHSPIGVVGDTCGRRGSVTVTVNVTHCQCQCHCYSLSMSQSLSMPLNVTVTLCQCLTHSLSVSRSVSLSMSLTVNVTVNVNVAVNVNVTVNATQSHCQCKCHCQCHSISLSM